LATVSWLLEQLAHGDRLLLEASQELHWAPFTLMFVIASAWWVKGALFVAAGALGDVHARRLSAPTAACAAGALGVAAAAAGIVKELVDRARPALADPGIHALVATPDSPSFPSGHAATAFAAAAAVASFYPRLRWPLYGLATLVGLSRIYLGVHYTLDVVAGAALGVAIGLSAAWLTRRVVLRRWPQTLGRREAASRA
jgi:undecaprenyl-diphosphatase